MRHLLIAVLAASVLVAVRASGPAAETVELIPVEGEGSKYWPRWRGPSGQGHVPGTNYTDAWSSAEHVKWRVAVPGLGHSSPIIWGDHLFLTTATDDCATLWMLAYSRTDGRLLWQTKVPTSGIEHVYPKNSRASATATTDGKLVYASFGTHGLAAFDFAGKLVWHRDLGEIRNYHGSAGSPVLYKDRLFLYQDHSGSADVK
jgi:outer membrane protein assembly factor BamB